jgi:glycosyltransferase involved in cell wall biosynthesis
MSLLKAFVSNAIDHDVHVVVSSLYPYFTAQIFSELHGLIDSDNIHIMPLLDHSSEDKLSNMWRSQANKYIREYFISQLKPDFVHISSLFEGFMEPIPASIGLIPSNHFTSVSLYDLIPMLDPDRYLPFLEAKHWYFQRIDSLKKADLLLAISNYSKREALETLDLDSDVVVSVGTDADEKFNKHIVEKSVEILQNLNVNMPFVLYTGAIAKTDPRKNCNLTIKAFSAIPDVVRSKHQLVLCGSVTEHDKNDLLMYAASLGLNANQLILTGWVDDNSLIALYQKCKVFVFPSMHEGFGLPVLEAIRCGAAVIASNRTSIPEVIGCDLATFDPMNESEFSQKLLLALSDDEYRYKIMSAEHESQKHFNWNVTATKSLKAMEAFFLKTSKPNADLFRASDVLACIESIACEKSQLDIEQVKGILDVVSLLGCDSYD